MWEYRVRATTTIMVCADLLTYVHIIYSEYMQPEVGRGVRAIGKTAWYGAYIYIYRDAAKGVVAGIYQ